VHACDAACCAVCCVVARRAACLFKDAEHMMCAEMFSCKRQPVQFIQQRAVLAGTSCRPPRVGTTGHGLHAHHGYCTLQCTNVMEM
jgi:hypothetical protein